MRYSADFVLTFLNQLCEIHDRNTVPDFQATIILPFSNAEQHITAMVFAGQEVFYVTDY